MPPEIKHPCDGMAKAERNAFDRIAAGVAMKSSTRTLSRLVDAGLIERHAVELAPADRFGPIVRYEYSVPLQLHIRWCEWMTRPRIRAKRKVALPQRPADDLPLFGFLNARTK